ncbi:MAG: dihydroorotate dehydrogenase-like protein [Hyphomicrobiales bacterium]
MLDLSTNFMGLELDNPIIVGSSGLTDSTEKIIQLEKDGAGAVVLKSIFEEEVTMEYEQLLQEEPEDSGREEFLDYLDLRIRENRISSYVQLIKESKKSTSIPIIASINCSNPYEWLSFAKEVENAGADALELNIYNPPSNPKNKSSITEKRYIDILSSVKNKISIPVALKISPYFTEFMYSLCHISKSGADGIVMFNKYYSPDIDIDALKITSSNITNNNDYSQALRWTAIASGIINTDICASKGINDSKTIIKMLLAGASAVQIVSALYKNESSTFIPKLIDEIQTWMKSHNFTSISDFKGILSQKNTSNPTLYERVQFMKYYSS